MLIQAPPVRARPRVQPSELQSEFYSLLAAEKACHDALRECVREIHALLDLRAEEESNVFLVTTVFEAAQQRAREDAEREHVTEETAGADKRSDFLTPYLVQYCKDPDMPSEEEAQVSRSLAAARRARPLA